MITNQIGDRAVVSGNEPSGEREYSGSSFDTFSFGQGRLGYWWRIRIEYFSLKMDWSSACQCSSGQSSRSFLPMCWQHFLSFSGRFLGTVSWLGR